MHLTNKLTTLTLFFLSLSTYALTDQMNVDDISQKAIADYIGIRVLKIESDVKSLEVQQSKAPFDSIVYANANYTRDETPGSSVFAATRSDQWYIEGGLEKKLLTGTEAKFEWISDRIQNDSSFVSSNVTYAERPQFSFRQPLMNNAFGYIDRLKLKSVIVDVKRFNFHVLDQMELVVLETRRLFWRVWEKQSLVEVEAKGLEDALEFLEMSKEKVSLGILEEPDLYAAQSNAKIRKIELLIAVNEFEDALNDLKVSLSIPLPITIAISDEYVIAEPGERDLNKLTNIAISNRYDIRKARLSVEQEEIEISLSKNHSLPQVDFIGSVALNGLNRSFDDAVKQATDGEKPKYFMGVEINKSLENTASKAKLKQSKFNLKHATLKLEQLTKEIKRDVNESLREERMTFEAWRIAKEVEELQKKKLSSEMKRFGQGRSSSDVIISFQSDVLIAQRRLLGAVAKFHLSQDSLLRVVGDLLAKYSGSEGMKL